MNNEELDFKLPVIEIFLEAVYLPIKHFRVLLKFGMPLIITSAVIVIYLYIFNDVDGPTKDTSIVTSIFSILSIATIVMAVVGCHRTFLMSSEDVKDTKIIRWTGREMRFIGWWIIIAIGTSIIAIPFALVLIPFISKFSENEYLLYLLFGLVNLPIFYFLARWSLVLPATAIDKRNRSLFWAWGLSKDNGLRLLVLIGVIPFLADLIFNLLMPAYNSLIYSFFVGMLWLVIGVIEIGLLSLSYAYLSKVHAIKEQ